MLESGITSVGGKVPDLNIQTVLIVKASFRKSRQLAQGANGLEEKEKGSNGGYCLTTAVERSDRENKKKRTPETRGDCAGKGGKMSVCGGRRTAI